MVHLLDDFHNIRTVRLPTNLKLSIASHMVSSLLDIHNIPAIKLPGNPANTHSQAKVLKNGSTSVCKGGIIVEKANEIMKNALKNHSVTYLESLSSTYHHVNTEAINRQIQQFR